MDCSSVFTVHEIDPQLLFAYSCFEGDCSIKEYCSGQNFNTVSQESLLYLLFSGKVA